jgi:CheY-like chemotaxis protein
MAVDESRQVLAGLAGQGRWPDALADLFEPQGIAVRRTADGPETISVVRREQVSVAVLAVEQPRLDGLSVLRMIRGVNAALPCVLVSPQASRLVMEQALGLGAYSVLDAPVDAGILAQVMRDIFLKFYELELNI